MARLARRLDDPAARIAELRVGPLDVCRTLSGALRQLPVGERNLMRRLAGHSGSGFTASDAAHILGLSEETAEEFLERLVEGSLLEAPGTDASGAPWYRFHALVRLTAAALDGAVAEGELVRAG